MFDDDVLFLQRFLKSFGFYEGKLDNDFGPLSNAGLIKFENLTDQIITALGRFDTRSEKNIITLHPKAQILARKFLAAVRNSEEIQETGVIAKIISGTRSYKEQAALYAQGRSKSGRIVTKAAAGRSNHNFGIAWDIGLFKETDYLEDSPLYTTVGLIGKNLGLEWGGDWSSFIDKPHFQLATGLTIAEVKSRFEAGKAFV